MGQPRARALRAGPEDKGRTGPGRQGRRHRPRPAQAKRRLPVGYGVGPCAALVRRGGAGHHRHQHMDLLIEPGPCWPAGRLAGADGPRPDDPEGLRLGGQPVRAQVWAARVVKRPGRKAWRGADRGQEAPAGIGTPAGRSSASLAGGPQAWGTGSSTGAAGGPFRAAGRRVPAGLAGRPRSRGGASDRRHWRASARGREHPGWTS